jgi:hypothetical protein
MVAPAWTASTHFAVAGGFLLATVVVYAIWRKGWAGPVGILFILAFHPAWTIEPGQEHDFGKRQAGAVALTLATAILVAHLCWIAWLAFPKITIEHAADYGDEHLS